MSAIDWRRARATARVVCAVARKIIRGVDLASSCALAVYGSALALFVVAVDLLRRFSASGERHAQQLDKALAALFRLAREQLHGEPGSPEFWSALAIGAALTVWSLREIVKWFRHTDKGK